MKKIETNISYYIMFLIDKYKVSHLDEIVFNKKFYNYEFNRIINNCQNVLVTGSTCSGKKTLVNLILSTIYGSGANNLKEVDYEVNNYGSNKVKVKLFQSNYHLVFIPNGSAVDKYVVQETITEYCQKIDQYYFKSNVQYKSIVILKAELLSEQSQSSLKTLMEKYQNNVRFFLVCKSTTCVIEPLKNRLLQVVLSCPKKEDMDIILRKVCLKEKIDISEEKLNQIINESKRNVEQALMLLQCFMLGIEWDCYWTKILDDIIQKILNNDISSTKDINYIREGLGLLFITNIEADKILSYMLLTLSKKVTDIEKSHRISTIISTYDKRVKNATRYILHLEAAIYNICDILHQLER